MDFIVIAASGMAIGFAIGWWVRGRQAPAGAVARRDYDKAVEEKITLATRLDAAAEDKKSIEAELEKTRSTSTGFHERAVAAEAENRALAQRLKEQQEQLRVEFSNTANKIFEEFTKKFSTQSEKQVGDLLNPLRERLGEFQKLVTESFTTQGKEQHTLKSEIEKIVLQTDSLTKALRGDVKAQGNWGEVMLEKILEESGLRKGIDYVAQGSEMGVEGNRLRPDYIIHLPEGKHVIIDSKVSITAYDRYCGESSDEFKPVHLKEFLRSIKNHVGGLEGKRYQDIEKFDTPEFVLMFMPIEGAYSLALQEDRELHSYAWGKKVAIVCPTTLFVTLQTIASIWRKERQNQNAEKIASEAGKLYDKFSGFVEDMLNIGKQLNRTQQTYDQAMNKLHEGRGNLVGRVENLKKLGAKVSGSLPVELLTDFTDEDTAETEESAKQPLRIA